MNHRKTMIALCTAFAIGLGAAAHAQIAADPAGAVTIQTTALVASKTGDLLENAVSVPPGQIVHFKSVITNGGKVPAKDVTVTNPVPEHMVFSALETEASGMSQANVTYSIDGSSFAAADALKIKIKKNGVEFTRLVEPHEYKFVRWTLIKPMAAGTTANIGFKALVE